MSSDTATTATAAAPQSIHEADAPAALAGHDLTDKEREHYARVFLDADATRVANLPDDFPFRTAEELIEHAKWVHLRLFVTGDFDVLSDDFYFLAPVIGPLPKAEFTKVWRRFGLLSAFPDYHSGMHDMFVDPHDPTRVFLNSRFTATHTGTLGPIKPTGKHVTSPPQMLSYTFDNDGKMRKLTTGYVVDREIGNTGGLGAIFGILYAIGKPLPVPECQPYTPSWQFRLFNFVAGFADRFFSKNNNKKAIKDAPKEDPGKAE